MRDQSRALVRGGAGTGKTLLAAEEASRFAAQGRRVLFCCRSAALAAYVSAGIEEELVDVRCYRSLLEELVDAADRRRMIPDAHDEDVLSVFLPEHAVEAILELDRIGSYDALVVDEGQDLMLDGALDVFDSLLDGGLDAGCWRVFLDHKQNVFDAVDRRQYDRVASNATTQFQLLDNCRNTPEISDTTAMLAAVEPDETLAKSGPQVMLRHVLDRREDAVATATVVEGWCRQGIEPSEIVILATEEKVVDQLVRWWPDDGPSFVRFDGSGSHVVRMTTAAEFKGLEAVAAVVVGVRELSERETLRSMYVGCSRPRALLAVVLDESARDDFELRAVEFARRRAGG
jgi:hypothetical protein